MKRISKAIPKFIKLNPCSTQKTPLIEPLYEDQIPSQLQKLEVQYVCTHCKKWLRGQTTIFANGRNYCVGCFAVVLPKCTVYQVLDHESYELVGDGWPVRHELLLLTGIEKFGFGNWNAIQGYMSLLGANYFNDQIQLHYDKFYGKKLQIDIIAFDQCDRSKVNNPSRRVKNQQNKTGKSIQKSTAYQLFRAHEIQNKSILCYNSKRGQLNIEYKQNLQKYISNLQFKQNDNNKQIQLKYQILQAYNLGLQDRIRIHNFILDHKLLDQNYQAQQNKIFQQNPYTNKAHQLLVELMRTITHEEYLELRKSIQFCLKIQSIIESLRSLRHSPTSCSIQTISQVKQSMNDSIEGMGKPRKKVHKINSSSREEQEKAILRNLNMSREELQTTIEKARHQNESIIYKQVKITPLNNLVQ